MNWGSVGLIAAALAASALIGSVTQNTPQTTSPVTASPFLVQVDQAAAGAAAITALFNEFPDAVTTTAPAAAPAALPAALSLPGTPQSGIGASAAVLEA